MFLSAHKQAQSGKCTYNVCGPTNVLGPLGSMEQVGHILRPQLLKLQARTLPACVAKCTTLYYQLQQKQQKQVKNCYGVHSSRRHGWQSGVGGYSESPTISQRVDVGGRLEFSWLTTMDYIWRTLDHISMSQYERSAFRQGAMFSRTGIFWMFVHCSFCHLRYVIPHPWHRSGTPGGASHPLHFASCIASKLRRADLESCWQGAHFKGWETLGEEKNEQLMINYRPMLAASLLYFLYIFFARPGNWKRSQCCEFCGFEDSCCRHPAVNIMVQMYKLLFTANHIVPWHTFAFFISSVIWININIFNWIQLSQLVRSMATSPWRSPPPLTLIWATPSATWCQKMASCEEGEEKTFVAFDSHGERRNDRYTVDIISQIIWYLYMILIKYIINDIIIWILTR